MIIGCTSRKDAHEVWQKLQDRLKKFGLELSCEKSRLMEFGEMAFITSERDGKKPNTFDFLGFTHYMMRGRKGGLKLGRKTIGKRMRRKPVEVNKELKRLRNALPFRELYRHLCRILKGYYNYFGFAGNFSTLRKFDYVIRRLWFKWLNRRSQRKSFKWKEFEALLTRYPLPEPRILNRFLLSDYLLNILQLFKKQLDHR